MQIIIGLGNPGPEYERTRHNVGRMALLVCREKWGGHWKIRQDNDLRATLYRQGDLLLVEPQVYMNESGGVVQQVCSYFKMTEYQNLYLIHDDLDLELGRYKVQLGTGPKIHNGLGSTYQVLGTENFWHVRVGIDSRQGDRTLAGSDYVLQIFTPDERAQLDQTLAEVADDLGRKVGADVPHPKPVVKAAASSRGGIVMPQDLFSQYQLEDKGGYITQEFQDYGYRLAVDLNDMPHKSLYIKMAKDVDRGILEKALSFVADAQARSKAKLFMWKVRELKKEHA